MNWYVTVLKKYAVFSGRARRKEYWMFVLFNLIFSFVLDIIDRIAGLNITSNWGVLSTIYGLAMFIPGLAVAIRRLHDTNRTGWWLFLGLIPIIGAIFLIIFMATEGQSSDNQYGPNPKADNPVTT